MHHKFKQKTFLTLTATSTVANTEVFDCVTVFSYNIAVYLCL